MPHLDPLPIADVVPELAEEIAAAEERRVVSSILPLRIWARRPDTARPCRAPLLRHLSLLVATSRQFSPPLANSHHSRQRSPL